MLQLRKLAPGPSMEVYRSCSSGYGLMVMLFWRVSNIFCTGYLSK